MILADTSVWIEHLRGGNTPLGPLLNEGMIAMHPFIAGELACGNLKFRTTFLSYLLVLPQAKMASDPEAMVLVESRRLWGKGLGWIDIHLIASAILSGCHLWSLDKRLRAAAASLGLAVQL